MAKLRSVIVSRYRSFKERTRLNVTPIVVMIGRNGSGKSVISRLFLIISDSLHYGVPNQPISLFAGGVRHASEFSDIPYMKSSMPFEIGAEIDIDGVLAEFVITVIYVKERERLIVESFTLSDDRYGVLKISLADDDQIDASTQKYEVTIDGVRSSIAIEGFRGFCPIFKSGEFESWSAIIEKFKEAIPPPSYLGPFRTEVGSFIGSAAPDIKAIGPKGENVVELMVDDTVRQGGAVCGEISKWFEKELSHEVLLERNADYARVILRPAERGLSITLSETGAGFSQILPIVAQNVVARLAKEENHCLIAEQPELHLHPAMHGAVADLYLSTSSLISGFILLETHSEQLIMRMRRRIAERSTEGLVSIWSVGHSGTGSEDSDVAHITFDKEGNPSDWPDGVFEETFVELTKLRAATRAKKT